MLTAYVVIGILLFVYTLYCVRSLRRVDSWDVALAILLFLLLWPIGFILILCVTLPTIINKRR